MNNAKLLVPFALLAAAALAQQQFDSPEAAAQALISAAAASDTPALSTIFGSQAKTMLNSGNPDQDAADRQEFATLAQDQHKLEPDSMNPNRVILSVGKQDWPFPVPIVKRDGKWSFDSAMGVQAMKARRIGADETDAIEICNGFVTAQEQYAEQHPEHDYAADIAQLAKLVPARMIAAASAQNPAPYHGYYFRELSSQGPAAPGGQQNYRMQGKMVAGFAMVAWPAVYGVTGIETFIVNQDGFIYDRDFGGRTDNNTQPPVNVYNPDSSWVPVE